MKEKIIDYGKTALKYGKGIGAVAAIAAIGSPDMTSAVHAQGPEPRIKYVWTQTGVPQSSQTSGAVEFPFHKGDKCKALVANGGPIQLWDGQTSVSTSGGQTGESYSLVVIGQPNFDSMVWPNSNFLGEADETVTTLPQAEDLLNRSVQDERDPNLQHGSEQSIQDVKGIIMDGESGRILETVYFHKDGSQQTDVVTGAPITDEHCLTTAQTPAVSAPATAPVPIASAPVESTPVPSTMVTRAPIGVLPLSVRFLSGEGASGVESKSISLNPNEIMVAFGQKLSIGGLDLSVDSAGDPSASMIVALINKGGGYTETVGTRSDMGYWFGKELSLGSDKTADLHAAGEVQINRSFDPSLNNCVPGGCRSINFVGLNRTTDGRYEVVFQEKWVRQ